MSYARWGTDSDIYLFAHAGGFVQCCGCFLLIGWESKDLHSSEEVVAHMQEHVDNGHLVPADLLDPTLYDPTDFEPYTAVSGRKDEQ